VAKKSVTIAVIYLFIITAAYCFQIARLLIQQTANDISIEYFILAPLSVMLRGGSHLFSFQEIKQTFQSEHRADKLLFYGDIIVITGLMINLLLIIYYGGKFIWTM